ncbi:MAG: SRPBCC family protein [Bacteroidota bacterium]|nr:SRPBCC family protein [Bacteroidota bacterium]
MKKLRTLHTNVTINASKEKVWDSLFTRFGEAHLYNPSLDGSHFSVGIKGEVGCERQCSLDAKTKVVERITQAEELKKFTVNIIGGNMPMIDTMVVELELKPLSSKQTTVLLTANYNTTPAFMGGLVKGMMISKFDDMLIGLKYFLETGKAVSKQTYKPISKMYQQMQPNQSFQCTTN